MVRLARDLDAMIPGCLVEQHQTSTMDTREHALISFRKDVQKDMKAWSYDLRFFIIWLLSWLHVNSSGGVAPPSDPEGVCTCRSDTGLSSDVVCCLNS